MDGNNFSQRGYISLIIVITVSLLGLLVTITSSDQKERGKVVERKHQRRSVEKSPVHPMGIPLRCGEMENKQDHSCLLRNV